MVWILVASTLVQPDNPLGWVMFVSVFCFVLTTLWFFIFLCGANQSSVWPSLVRHAHFSQLVEFRALSKFQVSSVKLFHTKLVMLNQ